MRNVAFRLLTAPLLIAGCAAQLEPIPPTHPASPSAPEGAAPPLSTTLESMPVNPPGTVAGLASADDLRAAGIMPGGKRS